MLRSLLCWPFQWESFLNVFCDWENILTGKNNLFMHVWVFLSVLFVVDDYGVKKSSQGVLVAKGFKALLYPCFCHLSMIGY